MTGYFLSLVLYRSRNEDLAPLFESLREDPFQRLLVLSSGCREDHDAVLRAVGKHLSERDVHVITRWDNLGFAGGHNYLLELGFRGADVGVILNPDLVVPAGALGAIAEDARSSGGFAGPVLESLRFPGMIDSAGIRWSADGRHFDDLQGQPLNLASAPATAPYGLTGACLAVSLRGYRRLMDFDGEFFDPNFVAYREDAELAIRARALGVPYTLSAVRIGHMRSVGNGERSSSPVINQLGVQNRFLMKWKLGGLRPGSTTRAAVRDLVVVAGVVLRERTSTPGLTQAAALRRYYRARGRLLRDAAM